MPGVVVEDVDPAVALGGRRVHRLRRSPRRRRRPAAKNASRHCGRRLLACLGARRRRRRPTRPPRRRASAASRPMPPAGAGDHRDLAVEPAHQPVAHEHVLDLRVAVERVHPELAPEAGLLEAAERRRHAHRGVRVDREHAGLERARDAERPRAVLASRSSPRARTACRWRSGSRRPRRRTGSPPRPARRPPRARPGRRSTPRRACTGTRSPAPSGASPRKTRSPSTKDATVSRCARRDQRPHLGRVVLGIADAHAARRVDEQLEEAVVGRALDEDPRAGAAVLAGVAEDGVRRGGGGALEVGVGEDDVRRLAAELERHALDRPRGALHHAAAHLGRAGEADLRDVRVLDEPLPDDASPARRRR